MLEVPEDFRISEAQHCKCSYHCCASEEELVLQITHLEVKKGKSDGKDPKSN